MAGVKFLVDDDFSIQLTEQGSEYVSFFTIKLLRTGWTEHNILAFDKGINRPSREYLIMKYMEQALKKYPGRLNTYYLNLLGGNKDEQDKAFNNGYASYINQIGRRAERPFEDYRGLLERISRIST